MAHTPLIMKDGDANTNFENYPCSASSIKTQIDCCLATFARER